MSPPSIFAPVSHVDHATSQASFTAYGAVRPPPPRSVPIHVPLIPMPMPNDPRCLPSPGPSPRPPSLHVSPQTPHARALSVPQVIVTPDTPPAGNPPAYATSSPPKYAPLPEMTEASLLLAPPPTYSHGCRCDPEGRACAHNQPRDRERDGGDMVVFLLIVLNVLIWTAVVYGYYQEWKNGPVLPGHGYGSPRPWDFVAGTCGDGVRRGKAWAKMCVAGRCR